MMIYFWYSMTAGSGRPAEPHMTGPVLVDIGDDMRFQTPHIAALEQAWRSRRGRR
jgi:hypothetical protein